MDRNELFQYVDHTALKAFTTWEDIKKLCGEAQEYQMASVCIPSCYVARAHEAFPELTVCTVIGFPLGNANTEGKIKEAARAIADGASEIDMVVNVGWVKAHEYDQVLEELKALRRCTEGSILKVIIETCYLSEDEKIKLCELVTEAGADFIKTSTGFGTGGAAIDDVKLMRAHIGLNVQIKAAGGIRTKAEMEAYLDAGCTRIGTSGAIAMLTDEE